MGAILEILYLPFVQISGGIADLHCRKVESNKWLKHKLRPQQEADSLNKPMADLGFLFLWVSPGDGWNLSHKPLGILRSSLALGQPLNDQSDAQNLQLHLKNISTSLRVCSSTICTKFNVQIGAGRHLKGFGLASLSGAHHGYMPPWLKTKHKRDMLLNETYLYSRLFGTCILTESFLVLQIRDDPWIKG